MLRWLLGESKADYRRRASMEGAMVRLRVHELSAEETRKMRDWPAPLWEALEELGHGP